ncbi:CusA/CzcA family heavy metal efflux RND transporter [Bradyrhizobium sp. CCBAU 53340]|uniref:efflux RND transporter permease subunit n=1 Tax=Bradyrhizobium sp. CCBAU 53340 TaxID=1325112 RepID=UPI00188B9832|nr:CusA/CzcA family heavy metal efflux RND transporter [Bradyrhizobium sp. CCBAU 53340]QOZ47825.1 CusA/CzcA family heavy metal efflux RND transporter [Bradyrhizobium sp. CCBAU 53340]
MIDRLVTLALEKRLVVAMICIIVAIYGAYCWTQLPVEAYPDVADTASQVVTQATGLAAEEVEQQVTIPLERELNGTPGLAMMRSRSTFGLSLITLVFRDGIEDYWSRQRIMERIQDATLPSGLTPGLDPLSSPTGQILYYILQSDTKNLRELSEIEQWTVIPAIKQVPGGADVSSFGGVTTQFQLELDPQQLVRFNLSLKNVTDAISANSASAGGSVLNRGELGYVIRGIGLVQTLDDLGNIVVTQHNGTPIFVRDLGKLKLANQERHGIVGKDGLNDVVEGTVLLLRGENPSRVLQGVHAKIEELNARLKGDGVQIVPYLDRSELVNATVEKVATTVVTGIALVLVILILFLGSPRSALIVGTTIPFAMVVAFILMRHTGISANLLSLGAIDFGIIVDGSIVMVEAILRRREARPEQPLSEADVRDAARQVARPIFFATAVIITTYLPLFALQRIEAKLFYPLAYAVGYTQFGALAFALLVAPGLAYLAWRRPRRLFHNMVLQRLEQRYRGALQGSLARPRIVYALSAAAAAAIVILGSTVWREFLPELDEGALWLHAELPPGISLRKATDMVADLRRIVNGFPEVAYIVSHIGRNDDGTDPWTPSHMEAAIGLRDYRSWPAGETKAELVRHIKARLDQEPGFEIAVSQPIIDSVLDKVFDPHSSLAVKVFGEDFGELKRIGKDIIGVLNQTPGVSDASIDQYTPLPQISIKVNREAAARFGINVGDVANLISTGIGGGAVTQVFIGERHYDVSVRFSPDARESPEAIKSLVLTSSDGALIPLSQIADIGFQTGESMINREMDQRYLLVKFNYRNRDPIALVKELGRDIDQKVSFDRSKYRIVWGGQFEGEQRAEAHFRLILGMVLGAMMVLLYAEFGVLRQVLLVICVVPLATLGGLLALHLTGTTLNVASGVGFIALFGVAVMNGVIMVANLNRMREQGLSLGDAVVTGASERLRPVLMTAAVATAGMLPAALAAGVGSDVQRSLATVVAGGLVPATLLTLFIIPTLYFAIERRAERRAAEAASRAALNES